MRIVSEELELGGKRFLLETGKLARQADGAVTIQSGDTTVLVTVMMGEAPRNVGFLPLTVDVEERMYAAGKIPGGFFRREGRPSEKSILTARLIDRPLRPSFPKNFTYPLQVIATILSVDQVNPPDVLAINGASAALLVSGIPFEGPLGAVRIARAQGKWIINPTYQELKYSDLDLVVAGNENAISMVEAGANEVSEEDFALAIEEAHKAIVAIAKFQERFIKKVSPPKKELELKETDEMIVKKVKEIATPELEKVLSFTQREERKEKLKVIKEEIREKVKASLEKVLQEEGEEEEQITEKVTQIGEALSKLQKEISRERIIQGKRVDGRGHLEIRPLTIEVGVLPRTHGTGLFGRGDTQVLTVLTLGTVAEEQRLDSLVIEEESKRFLHHYNFPPFSTGEIVPLRGPRRREIGHGSLVERALLPVIPEEKEFPYTVRLVSEVLESNGSTSMASVCASTLALMDAGAPIKAPVVGIAMGLVKEKSKELILTDILGEEDALGDMDFKVAGTFKGITALQMDIKLKEGLTKELLSKALEEAKKARQFILKEMAKVIEKPREEMSEFAPRVITLKISSDKIREVIGPGGKMIHSIIEETGASIDIEDDGTVYITSKDAEGGEKARQIVETITKEVKVGEKYLGTVKRITSFGAFVEILPGKEGLVHISKLSRGRVARVEDVVKVGDKILVEVIDIDKFNRLNLAATRP